ncbi:LysE family transporter, partial [Acinetobacter baumannii]
SGVYFNFVIGIVSQNIDSPTNPVRFMAYLSFLCFNAARSTVLNFSTDVNNLSDQAKDKRNKIKSLVLGLQSSLLNPKNIMFYSSLMLLIQHKFSLFQKLLMSVWMVGVVLIWNILLVKLLAYERILVKIKRSATGLYYCSAVAFILFAVLLITYK